MIVIISLQCISPRENRTCCISYGNGYPQNAYAASIDSVDFSQFTHVVYCLAVPDSDGTLHEPLSDRLIKLQVKKGAKPDTKVLPGFDGGASSLFDPGKAL